MSEPIADMSGLSEEKKRESVAYLRETAITGEAICIRNLGPIKNVAIENIKPFTVFIGESAGGKSAIMKAIALCRWLFKRINLNTYLQASGNVAKHPFSFDMDKHLEYAGLSEYVSGETDIRYTVYFHEEPQPFVIHYHDRNLETNGSIPKNGFSYSKLSYITETRGFLPFLLKSKGPRPAFEPHFEEMVEDFERARAVRKDLAIDFLNIRFSAKSTPLEWEYHVSNLDGRQYKIDFDHSSSGIQNTVPILLLASYFAQDLDLVESFNRAILSAVTDSGRLTDFRPIFDTDKLSARVYLHIEEPELGLSPYAQYDLLNRLVVLGSRKVCNPVHIMLTTHSPYVLNYLNLLIKAHDSGITDFTNGACLDYDNIAAYHVSNGEVEDLKSIVGQRLIDTDVLSDPINDIYDRYEELES